MIIGRDNATQITGSNNTGKLHGVLQWSGNAPGNEHSHSNPRAQREHQYRQQQAVRYRDARARLRLYRRRASGGHVDQLVDCLQMLDVTHRYFFHRQRGASLILGLYCGNELLQCHRIEGLCRRMCLVQQQVGDIGIEFLTRPEGMAFIVIMFERCKASD